MMQQTISLVLLRASLKEDCIHKDIWREAGGYVEKGPFPLPDTDVKVQVLSRDDNTGRCKLRVNPINADRVYVEVRGVATSASQLLAGRDYETDTLEVSFLAVDSSEKHNTGKAVAWRNTITLKSRVYQAGDDKMLELHAAPAAVIRYSTEGSDPKMFGGKGQVTIEAKALHFPTGAQLLAYVEDIKAQLPRSEVEP